MRGAIVAGGLVLAGIAGVWGATGGAWRTGAGGALAVACLLGAAVAILRPGAAAIPFLLASVPSLAIAVGTPPFGAWGVGALLLALAARRAATAKRRADREADEVDRWMRDQVAAMDAEVAHRADRQ